MILTRSPLRITLGGGGTDLKSYYEKFGAFFISAAIDKYVYLMLNRMFKPGFLLKYSRLEAINNINDIEHPIIRVIMQKYLPHESGIEIVSTADIPAGTGLGSSGSFTTSLLKSIYSFNHIIISQKELAEEACNIEINLLHEPIGKQDQYIAAYGGITCFEIDTEGNVEVCALKIDEETRYNLEDNLLLFFTGYSRNASEVLKIQNENTMNENQKMIENLHFIKNLGIQSKNALENGDVEKFAELMNLHWEYKKQRANNMSNERINYLYELALKNGALGGKLIGAGSGGFLMFYANNKSLLRRSMQFEGLREIRFHFDYCGTQAVL